MTSTNKDKEPVNKEKVNFIKRINSLNIDPSKKMTQVNEWNINNPNDKLKAYCYNERTLVVGE